LGKRIESGGVIGRGTSSSAGAYFPTASRHKRIVRKAAENHLWNLHLALHCCSFRFDLKMNRVSQLAISADCRGQFGQSRMQAISVARELRCCPAVRRLLVETIASAERALQQPPELVKRETRSWLTGYSISTGVTSEHRRDEHLDIKLVSELGRTLA